ncbi:MAG: hypothetical protein KIG53_04380 [Oscillospiraceae bacterium]|nr:hypothetical protein [Oscillospiraceae bacterium]
MNKKIISIVLTFVMVLGIVPFIKTDSQAAVKYSCYYYKAALSYASKNWDNGQGLCADFVSRCLQAGGVDVFSDTVKPLYDALKGVYGTSYKLTLTGGTSGAIDMSENKGKVQIGDPIFYKCNRCGDFEHVVICNGANAEGYCQDYAHNNAHNGKKKTYTYTHCGGDNWTLYSIRMSAGPTVYGEKSSLGIPEILSLSNGADGVVLKWGKISEATSYRVYRKTANTSWTRLTTTGSTQYVDKSCKDGTAYTYTVRAVKGKTLSQYYGGKSVNYVAPVKLGSVTNTQSGITVKWSALNNAGGYYVYRKVPNGNWTKIATIKNGKTTQYSDTSVKSGQMYIYTVKAYRDSVNGCYNSRGISICYLDTPELLGTENLVDGIEITFENISGADTYRIYRKSPDGKWKGIADIDGKLTSYTDTAVDSGKVYVYTVKAFKGKSYSAYNTLGIICEYVFGMIQDFAYSTTNEELALAENE